LTLVTRLLVNPRAVTVLVALMLQVVDCATTHAALKHDTMFEANPLMSWLTKREGETFAYATKLCIVLLFALWAYKRNWNLTTLAGTSALPVVNNILALFERKYEIV
jgi:hypothetical protein